MKKFGEIAVVVAFVLCIFAVPVLTHLEKPETYSIYENRNLATKPKLTKLDLFSGKYFKDWDTYLSDHLAGREYLLTGYVELQMSVLKKPVISDVVIAGDTLLPFLGYTRYDTNKQAAQIQAMSEELAGLDAHIRENGGKFLYVGIPEQHSALRDRYAWYFDNDAVKLDAGERGFFTALDEKGVPYLNMRSEFGDQITQYYSKIDHHYTYQGAYFTYQRILEALFEQGIQLEAAKVHMKALPNPFYGSRNRKLYNQFPTDERLVIGEPETAVPFTRMDNGKSVQSIVYAYSQDSAQPVTYTAYMGGDVAETVIDTNRPELPNVLIFGDSFTNPMETLFYLNCNQLRSIDLRHYTEKTLYAYIEEYKPDIVLCLRDDTNYWIADGNGTFR